MKLKEATSVLSIFIALIIVSSLFSLQNLYVDYVNAQSSNISSNQSATTLTNATNQSNVDLSNVNITMFRGACFGACPIYYLEIHGDGQVIYRGLEYVNVTGEETSSIPVDSVRELVNEFSNSGYFNLNDRYDQVDRTDQATVVTSISTDGKSKSIYDYQGTHLLPELLKLRQLENMIDQVTNSSQWVGVQALNSTALTS
jgi:hypothetical protein